MTQPYYVEWSPTTVGTETPSWESLGRVFGATYTRVLGELSTPIDTPTHADIDVRNSAVDGSTFLFDPMMWRKYAPVRIMLDVGAGVPVWTGYILSIKHDFLDSPRALRFRIRAVDALDLRSRTTTSRTQADVTEGAFLGFPQTIAAFTSEVDAGLVPSVETYGLADPPIMLPAKLTKNSDTYTTDAGYADKVLTTLNKMLDVELGHAAITADGNLALMGRYAVPDLLIDSPSTAALEIVGLESERTTDATNMPWRRGSLVPSDPHDEYRNAATTKSAFSEVTHHEETLATGEPADAIEYLDLWSPDENWVQANAELLLALYGNQTTWYPRSVDVLLWSSSFDTFDRAAAVHNATRVLGLNYALVTAPTPGGSVSWYLTIVGITTTITAAAVIATLYFSNAATRWDAYLQANSTSYKFFRLDDAGFGLDAGATLAP